MKKRIALPVVFTLILGVGAFLVFHIFSEEKVAAGAPLEVSAKSAQGLQDKIDAIKNKDSAADPNASSISIELSDSELESYVLFALKEDIPAQIDLIDVQLGQGSIASDAQLTFNASNSGNPISHALFGGTHNMFLKGKLAGENGRGKFELEEVRVDGIPVPNILVQTLFGQYVKPKYPEADLSEPFDLPWGIESLTIVPGKATVVY
jgi:hypothetical protein